MDAGFTDHDRRANPGGGLPRFVVVIPIVHGCRDLEACLDSLARLDYPRAELHVALVDCLSVPGTGALLERKLPRFPFAATALRLPERPQHPLDWLHEARANEARNLAVREVAGVWYVFTEDDCEFEADWLRRFEAALAEHPDTPGALGGPDPVPPGVDWLPRSLECVLASVLGTLGAKRGGGPRADWYQPSKENTLIPAAVLKEVGPFPEFTVFGADLEMARRIRARGLEVRYLPDNPVRHRRTTTFPGFVRRNALMAAEKTRMLRGHGRLLASPHGVVLLTALAALLLALLAPFVPGVGRALGAAVAVYALLAFGFAAACLVRTRSLPVAGGAMLLLLAHHASVVVGVLRGATAARSAPQGPAP